jgi:transcriptional regulator with XRE-family HTH domain
MAAETRRSARHAELAAFLRAQRARLRPADVGLPPDSNPGRRRTPGLRREEVAEIAGVSVTWYTWLEQGRNITASEQVIDAVARALRLGSDQRRHIRSLAGLSTTVGETPADDALPRLQRLVDAAAPSAACVYDRHFDYVAWNTPYRLIRHDPATLPAGRRNLLWMMFGDEGNRSRLVRWEPAARAVLSQFRAAAGQRPGDPRFAALVSELTGISPKFREWWAEYTIRDFRPATIAVDHPGIGVIELEIFQLRPVEHPDMVLVLQVPAGRDARQRVSSLLGDS